jgi:hypothetical protein|tara:strand:+ start:290 stop:484 length:195 start_codon:yes stop_codon:yes gene_type:complete
MNPRVNYAFIEKQRILLDSEMNNLNKLLNQCLASEENGKAYVEPIHLTIKELSSILRFIKSAIK